MNIKHILSILVIALCGSACSDWFDVSPDTQIKSDEFFKDETGFQSALTGCYMRMTKDETYGKNLSYYFLEKLAQRYDDTDGKLAGRNANVYIYTDSEYSKDILAKIWQHMYQTIANINNLIARLDKNGKEVIKTPGSWELMRGEALALRAFHHFDLLRMFGPIYKDEPEMPCIPYRTEFKPEKSPLLSASKVLENIIADLQEAEKYLAQDSVVWGAIPDRPFDAYRGHRMNKYATKALLARVYLYRGTDADKAEAGRLAKEVIDHCGLKLVRDNQIDNPMWNETLFGLNMDEMEDRVRDYFSTSGADNGTKLWIKQDNWSGLYETSQSVGINDIRGKENYGFYPGGTNGKMCRKYLPSTDIRYTEKIPLIRLGEMYLIAAEATGDVQYLNDLRNARGISISWDVENVDEATLDKEYRKEFFAEGQYFYFLKRHAMKTFYRCVPELENKMSDRQYVFPLPDGEKEYNWSAGETK